MAAILVLGGGDGHASLSDLINRPHRRLSGAPPGADGTLFPTAENMNFEQHFLTLVVPHDQG